MSSDLFWRRPARYLASLILLLLSGHDFFDFKVHDPRFGVFDLALLLAAVALLLPARFLAAFKGIVRTAYFWGLASSFMAVFSALVFLSMYVPFLAFPRELAYFLAASAALIQILFCLVFLWSVFFQKSYHLLINVLFLLYSVGALLDFVIVQASPSPAIVFNLLLLIGLRWSVLKRWQVLILYHLDAFCSALGGYFVRRRFLALALICLFAFALRLWGIDADLSLDDTYSDAYSSYAAYLITLGFMPVRDFYFTHIVLFPYVLSLFYSLFSPGIFVARAASALFNVSILFFVYLIGARLYNARVGLVAAFFYAFSSYSIWAGRYAVMENLQVFLVSVSVYLFLCRSGDINSFLSGAVLGLASLTKEPSILVLLPLGYAVFHLRRARHLPAVLLAYVAAVAPVYAYLFFYARDGLLAIFSYHLGKPYFSMAVKLSILFFDGIGMNLVLLVFFVFGCFHGARRASFEAKFLALWFLSFVLLVFQQQYFWHYSLALMPPMAILAAYGFQEFYNALSASDLGGLSLFVFLIFLFSQAGAVYDLYTNPSSDAKDVADLIAAHTSPGDKIVSRNLLPPLISGRLVPFRLFEVGPQIAFLIDSDRMIRVLEEEAVSCVVLDNRFASLAASPGDWDIIFAKPGTDDLRGFVDYVQANYRLVGSFAGDGTNPSVYCKR